MSKETKKPYTKKDGGYIGDIYYPPEEEEREEERKKAKKEDTENFIWKLLVGIVVVGILYYIFFIEDLTILSTL